jgi:hypothetical protein
MKSAVFPVPDQGLKTERFERFGDRKMGIADCPVRMHGGRYVAALESPGAVGVRSRSCPASPWSRKQPNRKPRLRHAQTDLRIDFHKPLTMHRHVVAVVQNDE